MQHNLRLQHYYKCKTEDNLFLQQIDAVSLVFSFKTKSLTKELKKVQKTSNMYDSANLDPAHELISKEQ